MTAPAPGPQFDSHLARALWNYIVVVDTQSGENFLVTPEHTRVPLPRYSTNIADTYKIAEHFQRLGCSLTVRSIVQQGAVTYLAAFIKQDGRKYLFSAAATLPMAICLAALAAIGGQNVAK